MGAREDMCPLNLKRAKTGSANAGHPQLAGAFATIFLAAAVLVIFLRSACDARLRDRNAGAEARCANASSGEVGE